MPADIPGGYYLKARKIQSSEIAHAPPHVREIWDWLIMEANHEPARYSGRDIARGQCIRSYRDIQEGLHWMVGWRKQTYSKNDCETAMRWLKKRTMVHTEKLTRGMLITICNYDQYQDPSNYVTSKETYKEHTRNIQSVDTINKNDKNVKNDKKKETYTYPDWLDANLWKQYKTMRQRIKSPMTPFAEKLAIGKLEKVMADEDCSQQEVIEAAIMNGWKTFWPPRGNNGDQKRLKEIAKQILDNDGYEPYAAYCEKNNVPYTKRIYQ